MDENILQKVLERAFSDPQLRSRLEADLDEALDREGYRLSSDERRQLKGILDEGKDTFATGLDQRLSQSGVSLSPQGLLRAKSQKTGDRGGLQGHDGAGAGRRQLARLVQATDTSFPGKVQDQSGHTGTIDDMEPDYEVETD
ncbi:MAG: Os1348 family NHLP clan protein [Sulfurimonas sp.]|nr:Os1348 family NHLP clan protein [Sulfurimonas sp.]